MSKQTIVEVPAVTTWNKVSSFFLFIFISMICGALITSVTIPYIFVAKTTADQGSDIITNLPSDLVIDPLMQKSHIYAKDASGNDVVLATFYDQNREPVDWDNTSQYLKDAFVSTEDPRFYEHGGVDIIGIGRAVVSNVLGKNLQGASTITQQYVKNVYIQKAESIDDGELRQKAYDYATEESINRKLREARLGIALEDKYSKNDILLGYMNIVNFGGTTYGIQAASKYYFNSNAKDLSLSQAATLAAIVNNPSNLRIDQPNNEINGAADGYDKTKIRRDYVLASMLREKTIDQTQYDAAKAEPIQPQITIPETGCAKAGGAAFFCDYVTRVIKNDPTFGATPAERANLLKRGGLQIYTTLDMGLQAATEQTLNQYAPKILPGMDFGAASASVQPGTGRILAMAENRDYTEDPAVAATGKNYTSVNYATDYVHGGSTGFQTGSTYKLFTLLEWLNQGHSLSETVNGKKNYTSFTNSCTDGWRGNYTFRNYDGSGGGPVTPKLSTQQSINTGFMEMAHKLDLCGIKNMAEKFGVARADGNPLVMEPSSVLGVNEIAPLNIATAFAGVAAGGLVCQPIAIDRIVDSENKEIEIPNANCTQEIESGVAGAAAVALQTVITAGTGKPSQLNDGIPMLGKTGTTDDNKQAWMSGATTQVATSVWTGNVVGSGNLYAKNIKGINGGVLRHTLFSNIMRYANSIYGGTGFAAPNPGLL